MNWLLQNLAELAEEWKAQVKRNDDGSITISAPKEEKDGHEIRLEKRQEPGGYTPSGNASAPTA